jgi:transposase
MRNAQISDALWARIAPLIPPPRSRLKGGRPRLSDRAALEGILFVLDTGIHWKRLPASLGYGSGVTCWRRLRDWQQAGIFEQLHRLILDELGAAGKLDWTRALVDTRSVPAKKAMVSVVKG